MINAQYINLNMKPSGVMPVLYCSQYDIGRPLGMVVYNGSEAVDLDTYTCTIEATRTDGTAITAAVTTSDNIGAFVTTATMTNQADRYPVKLVLFDSNSRRVASLAFIMCVTPKTMDENAESIEEDASLYQQYTQTVQSSMADIRADLEAEITARQNAVSAEATARQNAITAEANARAAAVSAEAAARQSADNVLQSNIDAEASTRATQDASLQSQINQIIAPSGDAPSAAEVENARIGADGVTYSTLGVAIRTQVTNLNNASCKYVGGIQETTDLNGLYENGWYRVSSGITLYNSPESDSITGRRLILVYSQATPATDARRFMLYYNAATGVMAFRVYSDLGWQPWNVAAKNTDLWNTMIMAMCDLTYHFSDQPGYYWNVSGEKASSSAATCTNPIYVPSGTSIMVTTGMGSSGAGITEVSANDAYVSTILVGSCHRYIFTASHDCYVSISSVSSVLPDEERHIYIIDPLDTAPLDIEHGSNQQFEHYRYGYYTNSQTYAAAQLLKCLTIPVKPGDYVGGTLTADSIKSALYLEYDDGTSEYVLGRDRDNPLPYHTVAKKSGVCHLSSYFSASEPMAYKASIYDDTLSDLTCKIFKRVVCIGDSYTAGWISEDGTGVRNNPNFNFPHFMSTLTGNDWVDCGASGTTVLTWQANVNGWYAAKTAGKAQAYVIGLGINDRGSVPIGTADDIGTDAQTYYGGLSQIIEKVAGISPDAKIFVNTNPNSGNLSDVDDYNAAVRTVVSVMSATYNVYLIDLAVYSDAYHSAPLLNDFLQGHFTAVGYEQFAQIYARILSQYINANNAEFQDVAFLPYDAEMSDATVDLLTADGTALTTGLNTINAYGKYIVLNNRVYFHALVYVNSTLSDGTSNTFSNLPQPSDTTTIFFERRGATVKQKPSIRYTSSGWRMTGAFVTGDILSFAGSYSI